jgi:YfiH family protein
MLFASGSGASARWVVTDRNGGESVGPYDSLNLGDHVGDDPDRVAANRARVATEIGLAPGDLRFMNQVHGAQVAQVGRETDEIPAADGLVTAARGIALAVLVADCVPVLLAARRSDVIAVAHAGRRGVAAGVVAATVSAMQELGARPSRIVAKVGPAICGRCYEVPLAMQEEICSAVPEARSTTAAGTPGLDLRAAVVAQLMGAGVQTIEVESWCTAERDDLYSHRRDGVSGRFGGLVWLPARAPA